ncbi:MAG TPA: 4-(cytidine 5'-diphospho)-2-C-methyl-D-erythritol kinase, partial [Armatimonadota bacterium]|nr:4-(cytidine 5'-diphospho)-2-C-methyl-D-erythritol kinase [Armatimonadota bacterium]
LDAHLVIAKPAVGVSTARAYAELDALRAGRVPEPCDDAIATMRAALERGDRAGVVRALRNDLEAPVLAMHPEIAGLKAELLARGAEGALLSGSGSAVFGLFATEDAARECAGALAERWPWVCVARPWRSR